MRLDPLLKMPILMGVDEAGLQPWIADLTLTQAVAELTLALWPGL